MSNAAKKLHIASDESPSPKREIFRQTRYVNEDQDIFIQLPKARATLKNWSRTGIAFEVPNDSIEPKLSLDDVVSNVKLMHGSIVLLEGDIQIRNVINKTESTVYGAAIQNSLFLIEGVEAASIVNENRTNLEKLKKQIEEVPGDVCKRILTLAVALERIKTVCTKEEKRWRKLPFDQRCEAERIFLPNMSQQVSKEMSEFSEHVSKSIDVETLPDNSIYHKLINEVIYPFFTGAQYVKRAFEKPRGYAGDYEMMNQIYRDSFEGETLFDRILHNYGITEAAAESVKFRKPFFVKHYQRFIEKGSPIRALSVASGPAVEVQELIRSENQSSLDLVHTTLFDLDREALEHAQTKIREVCTDTNKSLNIEYVNASIKSLLTDGNQLDLPYDYIYSGGLFDYLDNVTSAAIVRKLFTLLNPGGRLIIGNFTKENTTKVICHLLTDWRLDHKTESEMRAWATGIDGCRIDFEYDHQGINAFIILTKNEMD